jgi:hypothetical protein
VEIGARVGEPAITEAVLEPLELAEQRGVVLSQGWVFLLPRILGLASATLGRTDEACTRLSAAVEMARHLGTRVELARALVDAAHVWRERASEGDALRTLRATEEVRQLAGELALSALAGEAPDLVRTP